MSAIQGLHPTETPVELRQLVAAHAYPSMSLCRGATCHVGTAGAGGEHCETLGESCQPILGYNAFLSALLSAGRLPAGAVHSGGPLVRWMRALSLMISVRRARRPHTWASSVSLSIQAHSNSWETNAVSKVNLFGQSWGVHEPSHEFDQRQTTVR